MKNDEILIEALIVHGAGGCPECGGSLFVADSELSLMELNQDGTPISEETVVRCEAACSHCGHKQKMIRWDGGYIPFSRSSFILKSMQRKDEMNSRIAQLNSRVEGNPFSDYYGKIDALDK